MRLRDLTRKILDAISFGDLVFVAGVILIFRGLDLVYGFGWACIGIGVILIATAYMGDLTAMAAALIHGGKGKK